MSTNERSVVSLSEAQRLLREGRIADAERAAEAMLQRSPDDVEALTVVALAAMRGGRTDRAVAMLEHARRIEPGNPVTLHHLGRLHAAIGDQRSALGSFGEAVRLKPDFYLARLHYATALERSGDATAALMQFARALLDAQSRGEWINAGTTPPSLQRIVRRASQLVRARRRALLSGLVDGLAARYGRDSLGRVERCLRIYLGEEQAARPDARQQPTFLYFPDIPASPYLERRLFPWIDQLEAETEAIRDELTRLLPSAQGRERVFTTDELERENLRGMDATPSWNGYYFYRHGVRRAENCGSCPATAAAIDQLPLSRVRDHGPEVLFSVFTPGTHLLPHRGVTNTRVVGHLPLIVPVDCALKVGGEVHAWKEGAVVVFDDTYEHEAWNRSRSTRVILIFDVWNPHLTETERAAVTEVVEAIGDFRVAVERL
jgi:aspartate beta-hydroxylase